MPSLDRTSTKLLNEKLKECNNLTDVVTLLYEYKDFDLKPSSLGIAFEKMYVKTSSSGFSSEVKMSELIGYHHSFRTSNGSTWCRTNNSYLGKRYDIKISHHKGSISSIRLDGFNRRRIINNTIRKDILNHYKNIPCAILDITSNIECDHKDGLKDDWRLNDPLNQDMNDFQSLSKTANDAKRSHCKRCKDTGIRYDAKKLGYKVSYLYGNKNTRNCDGCYWCDPKKFNKIVSENYIKPDEKED